MAVRIEAFAPYLHPRVHRGAKLAARLLRFSCTKSVWFEDQAETPSSSGAVPSVASMITLRREPAEAVPQRPVRCPMGLTRTDVDGLEKGPARPQAHRTAGPGRSARRIQRTPLHQPHRNPLEISPARLPEPRHRLRLLRRLARRGNPHPAQPRPHRPGPREGRTQARTHRVRDRHPEREDLHQRAPGQPGNRRRQENRRTQARQSSSSTRPKKPTRPSPKAGSTPASRTPSSNTEPASESTSKSSTELREFAASTLSNGAGSSSEVSDGS